ncbi:hypothetical protein MMAN_30650 [Mycobacterium mantenii]|uniref:Uncharacterized protein n=1 Tax=Mycobacterium mantenii TaxID=560555 RepID=A0ABM7JTP9_MYCNT|nr:hypothetical protein MMAN_30650 [Mycobacterium mantenii]
MRVLHCGDGEPGERAQQERRARLGLMSAILGSGTLTGPAVREAHPAKASVDAAAVASKS